MNNLWKTGQIATLYITIKAKRKKVKVIFFWHRSEKHPISVFGLFVTKVNSMTVKPVRHLEKKKKKEKHNNLPTTSFCLQLWAVMHLWLTSAAQRQVRRDKMCVCTWSHCGTHAVWRRRRASLCTGFHHALILKIRRKKPSWTESWDGAAPTSSHPLPFLSAVLEDEKGRESMSAKFIPNSKYNPGTDHALMSRRSNYGP